MEYTVLTNVRVQQVPSEQFPKRNLYLEFSFVHKYEGSSTWEDLTQTLKLVLPKKVTIKGWETTQPFMVADNAKYTLIKLGNTTGANSNLGGGHFLGYDSAESDSNLPNPTFLRGDMVIFNVGYRAVVNGGQVTYMTGSDGLPDLFTGFISNVQPKLPFTIDCEDNMWLLKQMPTPNKNWQKRKLQDIVREVINSSQDLPLIKRYGDFAKFTVSDFSKQQMNFNVQNLTTTYNSLAAFLARLKTEYRVYSYFRGNELRIGYLTYDPSDNVDHTFTFQKNILDNDKLVWQRKDDVVMSMIVKANYLKVKGGSNVDGTDKTTHASTEILIYGSSGKYDYVVKEKGKDFPTKYLNEIGERYTFLVFDNITDPKQLFNIGVEQLKKKYYDGFKGSFTTFGIPYVKHGDTVRLINPALPEQDGYYKVKGVNPNGGYNEGLRQEIFIDYKINAPKV